MVSVQVHVCDVCMLACEVMCGVWSEGRDDPYIVD